MVFKKNVAIKLICCVTEYAVSFIPILILLYFYLKDNASAPVHFLYIFASFASTLIPFILITALVVFYSRRHDKTRYIVGESSVVIDNGENTTEIFYTDVSVVEYDLRQMRERHKSGTPSHLTLLDKDEKPLLHAENPPLRMVHIIKKNCHTKVRYFNKFRFLQTFIIVNLIFVIVTVATIINL